MKVLVLKYIRNKTVTGLHFFQFLVCFYLNIENMARKIVIKL